MAPLDLAQKYSNFYAPKCQIKINAQDITQQHGITTALTAELDPEASKFCLLIDDPQAKWVGTPLFEVGNAVEIKMGYAAALETVIVGEITEVKSVFSASHSPQIEVCGEDKRPKTIVAPNPAPICNLVYGNMLLNFKATETKENPPAKTLIAKVAATNAPASSLCCVAECMGLPEIKNGVVVTVAGLGKKFNQNYLVEKVVHCWDAPLGFKTRFEGKALRNRRFLF